MPVSHLYNIMKITTLIRWHFVQNSSCCSPMLIISISAGFLVFLTDEQVFVVVVVSGQKFNVFSCPLSHTIDSTQSNEYVHMKMNQKLEHLELCCMYEWWHWGHFSYGWCRNRNIIFKCQLMLYCYSVFCMIIWHFKSCTYIISKTFFSLLFQLNSCFITWKEKN